MEAAEQHQVVQGCTAAVEPVLDVVAVDEAAVGTTRKAAPLIAQPQRPFDCCRYGARAPSDVEHPVAFVYAGGHEPPVARDSP